MRAMKAKSTRAIEVDPIESARVERVGKLLAQVLTELRGMDHPCGESDTERFMVAIMDALWKVDKTVRRSHRDGLCYHCTPALAEELCKLYPMQVGKLQ